MKKELIQPSTVRENEYLSKPVVSFIFGVKMRQVSNIANKEKIEKAYYSTSADSDLVCYLAIDVYRVAIARRNPWPDPWPKEYMNAFVEVGETYSSDRYHPANDLALPNQEVAVQDNLEIPAQPEKREYMIAHESYIKVMQEAILLYRSDRKSAQNLRVFQYGATIMILATFLYFAFCV